MPQVFLPLLIALLPLAAMAILQFILPVLAPLMMPDIGRRPEDYGWIGGAIGLGSVLLLMTSHLLLPAFGPVRTLRVGLVFAVLGIMLVLSGMWPLMLIGGVLMGYGYGTTTPAGSQVLADFTPRSLWGTLFSLRMAAVPLGGVIAGALGGLVAPGYGWRTAFAIVIGACIGAFVVLLVVPVRFNEGRPPQPFRLRGFFDGALLVRPVRIVGRIAGLPTLAMASWCLAAVHSTVTSFFVIYLVATRGMPLTRAASLFAVLQVSAICGRVVFGTLADRIGNPVTVLKLLAPLGGCSAVLLSSMAPEWSDAWLAVASGAIGAVVGTFTGLYLTEVARLAPVGEVGDATASTATFIFTAYLVVPPLAGLSFATWGGILTLRLVTVFSAAALVLFVWRDRHAQPTLAKDG